MTGEVVEVKAPHITKVMEDAEDSLEHAEFPGLVGTVFNPVRDTVLLPVTEKFGEVLPIVADAVPLPFVDEVTAFAMSVPLAAMKTGYRFIPNKNVDDEAKFEIGNQLKSAFDRNQKPQPFLSSMMGVVGFAANSVIDIVTLPFNGKVGDWIDSTKTFLGFLVYSGVGKELMDAFIDLNAVENMMIIGRVQTEKNQIGDDDSRRARTAMSSLPPNVDEGLVKHIIADSTRYVRYASAAYGVSMIDSAETLQVFGKNLNVVPVVPASSKKARERKISKYVGIKQENILSMTKPGGSMDVLGHFVAVDKRPNLLSGGKKAVVLAIRGTYTLSGLKVDASAYSQDFCDGYAHAGIAEVADKLWEEVKETVVKALLDNPGFDLVITGHSLGAGSAALLALKLKYEDVLAKENEYLKDVKIRCFAFAPPPVYFQAHENEKLTEAMKDTYPFIHEKDCVPFASVDAIRRLADTLVDVDKYPKGLLFSSPLRATGLRPIPDDLKEIIMNNDREVPPAPDSHKLAIPAPFVMWLRETSKDENNRPMYNAMFCRPQAKGNALGTNDLNIQLSPDMIKHHMNPQYERAIMSVRQQMLHKKETIVFPTNPEEECH